MLDILQAIIEWLLPIFLPSDELQRKTNEVVRRSPEAQPPTIPIPTLDDSIANAFPNGLTGTHFMMVLLALLVTTWLVISKLTTRVVKNGTRKGSQLFQLGVPVQGIAGDDNIYQEHFEASDLQLKWLLERHAANLRQLHRHQMEQDIKFSYLQRRLSRRERPHSHRRRPDFSPNLKTKRVGGRRGSSEQEIDVVGEKRCRCTQLAKVVKEPAGKGNGDGLGEETNFKDEIAHNVLFGQGDTNRDNQSCVVQRCPLTSNAHQRPIRTQTPNSSSSSVAKDSLDLDLPYIRKHPATIIDDEPPPRPDPPRRSKLTTGNIENVVVVDRFMERHPEAESMDAAIVSPSPEFEGCSTSASAVVPVRRSPISQFRDFESHRVQSAPPNTLLCSKDINKLEGARSV